MKVLVVDDSPMQQKIAKIYLEKGYGYTLLSAWNGRDGLDLARKELPDVILMDMEMPQMSGLEALTALKNDPSTRAIPVIMCTSVSDGAVDFKAAGASGYLKKPHGYSALNTIIHSIFQPSEA